jgi:hypothetical protein
MCIQFLLPVFECYDDKISELKHMIIVLLPLISHVRQPFNYKQIKKSLKIPNGLSKSVNWRSTNRSKEKGQQDKQRSTKHTHKTKHRVTRTPTKNWGEPEFELYFGGCYLIICIGIEL